ncbi:hypothetical protein CHI02_09045 [Niallia circulans]|uniref:glycosyltransferase family 8 protein n=1 Tax=Niallia circulans TaxID=1397 RepID=UPI000BA6B8CA|nr:glycosyltransferase family 8 protein [Niallia circulans]PAE12567.1 hypothetical protein CHI02_09045 [Niallia circulans]
MEKLNIVYSVDNNYIQHFVASLTSLLENYLGESKINIVVIDGGIEVCKKKFLVELVDKYNATLSFEKINNEQLNGVNLKGHIAEAAYYRLMIPDLFFDNNIEKVVYLDCDVIVRDDIRKLWDINIGDCVIGAIKLNEYNGYDKIDVPKDAHYFNSGVLVINLDKWRKEQITRKAFEYIKSYPEKLIAHDQSILNYLLYDKWYQINYKWNLRTQLFSLDYKTAGFDNIESFEEVKDNPSIVHFTTASKPWHYVNNHPFKNEYFYYLDKSEFGYEKYPEKERLFSIDIILFGTGENSKKITNYLSKFNLGVSLYLDNDNEKDVLFGTKVRRPDYIKQYRREFLIIIASQYKKEISDQLINLGLLEGIDFIRNIDHIGYNLSSTIDN